MQHPESVEVSRGPGNFGPIAETRRLRIKLGHLKRSLRYLDTRYVQKRERILADMGVIENELVTELNRVESQR